MKLLTHECGACLIESMETLARRVEHLVVTTPLSALIANNWGLGDDHASMELGDGYYINGFPLIVDLDLRVGILAEVAQVGSRSLLHLVVVVAPYRVESRWIPESQSGGTGEHWDIRFAALSIIRRIIGG